MSFRVEDGRRPPWLVVILTLALCGGGAPRASDGGTIRSPADSLRIGLVVSVAGSTDSAELATKAAVLAVEEANVQGGSDNRPFALVVRQNEGPWGSGANRIAELIFDEGALAIAGSLDGRGAHLVEQIATKGRVAFVSSWASDPTVTQAYVPWVFRCLPDDRQQATAILHAALEERRIRRLTTIRDDTYDMRLAEETFARAANTHDGVELTRLQVDKDMDALKGLAGDHSDGIVLFLVSESAGRALRMVGEIAGVRTVLGPLALTTDAFVRSARTSLAEVLVVSPGHSESADGADFQNRFRARWGLRPDARAAYAFDAVGLVITAIREVGPDRSRIRKALSDISYEGVTGSIRFDLNGNRLGTPSIVRIDQIPVVD